MGHGGVSVEVYYDRHHPWNVATLADTAVAGLGYFGGEFAPYPLSFFRIAEFPGYRTQAQAHAGTINYSETVGFTNELKDWAALDYTTIHELGHQWWGGFAYGARMQGRQILNELNHPLVTLAETMDGGADKAAELANA